MNALIKILGDDAALSAVVGSQIYPYEIPKGKDLPAITIQHEGTDPNPTKGEGSTVDEQHYQVYYQAMTYQASKSLAELGRQALDNASGSYAGESIGYVQLEDEDTFTEVHGKATIYLTEQVYLVWKHRN